MLDRRTSYIRWHNNTAIVPHAAFKNSFGHQKYTGYAQYFLTEKLLCLPNGQFDIPEHLSRLAWSSERPFQGLPPCLDFGVMLLNLWRASLLKWQ